MTMPTTVGPIKPTITPDQAERALETLYGVQGRAEELPGELDRNFLVSDEGGPRYVLKVYHVGANTEVLDFQNHALAHVAQHGQGLTAMSVVRDRHGHETSKLTLPDGTTRWVRLLTWLPGGVMAEHRPYSPRLLYGLGHYLGRLDRALAQVSHPAMQRHLLWAMRRAPEHRDLLAHIADPERRELARAILEHFVGVVEPILEATRRQVVHHDANDYNVLVRDDGKVVGVIDFGDMVEDHVVSELAVACAYGMMGQVDPLTAVLPLIAGFHDANPLTDPELGILLDLIRTRLAQSMCMAASQYARDPANEYLLISQRDAWTLLQQLQAINSRFAHFQFRDACGRPPNPNAGRIVDWLIRAGEQIGSVCRFDLGATPVTIFDWSEGSDELAEINTIPDTAGKTRAVFDRMRRDRHDVGIGRYREHRGVYTSDLFRADHSGERRSVHMGVDVFLGAGEEVRAPLDGRVHLTANNSASGDYGPVVILEHRTDTGLSFWTLYGHLSLASLERHRVGDFVRRGDVIGWIGDHPVNGDWVPHLHLQLFTDLIGRGADIEGVVKPSQTSVWESISPDPNILLGIRDAVSAPLERDRGALARERRRHLSPSLSLSYAEPLKIVRGAGQFLYDESGGAWLDMVNNVCHVGHCHPRVVGAGQAQMAELNTNTRYLHDAAVEYARRLTATLPEPLSVCFFVNSGSEANDLALRLSRAATGGTDTLVVDAAYHGNLTSLIDLSPYKFNGPGGAGRPPRTWVCEMPDGYRGRWKTSDPACGHRYAEDVARQIECVTREGRRVGAFFAESILSCGGQIVLPDGYLRAAYDSVRAAGGVCVADEVQVGFGRVGTHMWAFETQGVVPDIVTMGKPIGNGHPLGAVVTTPEIAAKFANGMEYFNTFGGNPVSMAIGLAVLDVMRDERLRQRALLVGTRMLHGLRVLQAKHALIGDVRGLGLFVGIELVTSREMLTPARVETKKVIEGMKQRGILLSIDGPLYNVIKIKPPMVFNEGDCDRFLAALDEVVGEVGAG